MRPNLDPDWGMAETNFGLEDGVTVNGQKREQKKTCAEVAAHFVEKRSAEYSNGFEIYDFWISCFKACADFPQPKKTKQVWQWRKWNGVSWVVLDKLMLEIEEVEARYGNENQYEKHAGPFEVKE